MVPLSGCTKVPAVVAVVNGAENGNDSTLLLLDAGTVEPIATNPSVALSKPT